ncbi:MAG TPA: hydrogenase maturation protease [Anaerolineae bacterium]|nr:hydrogenase maturation protease [Anaerolineae bacterium]
MSAPRVLIGGVGHRWQRDASFGLIVCDALAGMGWPAGVEVADLGYGALYVAQDLAAAEPPYDRLILLAGMPRERRPGRVYCRPWEEGGHCPEEIQARIREAGAGVIDLDHLLVIGRHLAALPPDVLLVELEPVDATWGEALTPAANALVPPVVDLVREVAQAPIEQFRACRQLSETGGVS